jgi:hypothetical protein
MTGLLMLTLGVTATAAPAQEQPDDDTYPTDAEVAAGLEPIVQSETRSGDVTTITLEIPVSSDTFTTSGKPNNNWATDPNLRVGYNTALGNGAERTFLFFDVSSIPSNATIQSAQLRAFLNGFSPNGDAPMGLLARFLNSAWDPNTLTWNNYNPSWGAEIGVGQAPAATGWIQGNITDPVAQWVSGARVNNGILIQGDETPQQRERIFTALNANNGLHSRIVVTYDVIVDTTPPTSSVTDLPQWSPATFTVRWSGSDNTNGSGIRNFDVQTRTNGGSWQNWQLATTATSASFTGTNGNLYEFRSRATDNAGNVEAWPSGADTGTTVDTVPPVATVNPLPQFTFSDTFTVSWGATDTGSGPNGGSGIAHFDVQYQLNGGPWTPFILQTTTSSGQVLGATAGQVYAFRARAVDRVGNVQAYSANPQASTTISLGSPAANIVPFNPPIAKQTSFIVQWVGQAVPGSTIVSYDVEFSVNGGPWSLWLSGVSATSQQFSATQGDGVYAFQVRARDNAGRVSTFTGGPGSSIAVDTVAPSITIRAYVPSTFDQ